MYSILTRYEYRTREGKKFTEWIEGWFNDYKSENKKELELIVKSLKEKTKPIDKATKLKHEYKIGID